MTAPIDAVVTKINLTTGEKMPDGTAMLLTDTAAGNRLVVQVDADQEKYIAKGDQVTVTSNSGNSQTLEDLTVDNVQTNEEDDSRLDVTIKLPEDSLETGTSADMKAVRTSQLYDCTVPLQALYADSGQYFVYVLTETDTVLGTQQTVKKVNVEVLEKNETKAALASGSISDDQRVVVSSNKTLSDGSRVREQEDGQ